MGGRLRGSITQFADVVLRVEDDQLDSVVKKSFREFALHWIKTRAHLDIFAAKVAQLTK